MKRFLQGAVHAALVIAVIVLILSFVGWIVKRPQADQNQSARFSSYLGCLNEYPDKASKEWCRLKALSHYPVVSR